MAFAMANVLVRQTSHLSIAFKSTSIWLGVVLMTGLALLFQGNITPQVQQIAPNFWIILGIIGLVICATSFAVQYGLSHTPANRAIVIFLFELVFAAVAAYLLVDEKMDLQEIIGAMLIISASLLSGKLHNEPSPSSV